MHKIVAVFNFTVLHSVKLKAALKIPCIRYLRYVVSAALQSIMWCTIFGEDREDSWRHFWQVSNPQHSSTEILSQGASPEVLPVSIVGAIPTPICSCDE